MARVLISAGFDGAIHVIATAELLRRARHDVAGILVVSPFGLARARSMLRQRGLAGLMQTARRLWQRDRVSVGDALEPLLRFVREHEIHDRSLKRWARRRKVPYHVVSSLNEDRTIEIVRSIGADGLLYGGGGILNRRVLEALDGRVLNAHMGRMPEIRGMNACEWSLMLGISPTVTIHFIERGIDTGPIVEQCPITVEEGETIERLRSKCTVVGVDGLVRNAGALSLPIPGRDSAASGSRQCYLMAPVLLEVLRRRLAHEHFTE